MKRLLALILVLCFFVISLVGCNGDTAGDATQAPATTDAPTGEPTDKPTDKPTQEVKQLVLIENGVSVDIVYPVDADVNVKDLAESLAERIEENTGVAPNVRDDYIPLGEERDTETVEILVGDTDYDERYIVQSMLRYGSGGVACEGNKIVVVGTDNESLAKACSELNKYIRKNWNDSGRITIPADYNESYVANEDLYAVPVVEGATLSDTHDMGDGGYLLRFDACSRSTVDSYVNAVEKNGFAKRQENARSADNYFATFVNEEKMLSVMYTGSNETLRLVIENDGGNTTLIPSAEELGANDPKICEPLFTQIGIGGTSNTKDIGQSYVIRLEDGTFAVIDGGYNESYCSQNIYKTMVKQAVDANNIVITAWFITHPHGDHYGALIDFGSRYKNTVEIKYVIYNTPSSSDAETEADPNPTAATKLLNAVKSIGAKPVKTHAGNIFNLAGVEVEMIYTYDLLATNLDKIAWYNNFSLVFNMEIAGVDFMILGDCAHQASPVIRDVYGDYLKSDVVQVAHHGIGGVPNYLYKLIDADYAVWPTTKKTNGQPQNITSGESDYLIQTAKKNWVADKGIQVFSFGTGESPGAFAAEGGSFDVALYDTGTAYFTS